jgi:hypothetical protein
MPKLAPLPIRTKGKSPFVRTLRWLFTVRKWELQENWQYQLPRVGREARPIIVIPKGFICDGASIPRPLWALLSPTGLLLIPGLVHDFAYRFDYLWAVRPSGPYKYPHGNAGRAFWDDLFWRVGKDVNGMLVIDCLAWVALSLGGWWTWQKWRKPKYKPVEITPNLDTFS